MSAQGATLGGRGTTLHLPIWPVAVLVAAVAAVTIGVTMIGEQSRDATRPFTLTGEAANSTTAIREAGVVLPAVQGISHVAPSVQVSQGYAGFENPGAYITEVPAYAGFENPAAYGTATWDSVGGQNEALHRRFSPPQEDVAPSTDPIIVNGHACMQCR
jgi:hypothetical protein